MSDLPQFDADLLRRHDRQGPRYTSYPAAPQFSPEFTASQFAKFARLSNERPGPRPLSLYLHIPYCHTPCFYCGCNRLITRDASRGIRYTEHLLREVELLSAHFERGREVVQLHLGGGSPNFLHPDTLTQLVEGLGRCFRLSPDSGRDFSIELDPRSTPAEYAAALPRLGFNRVSLGVQDFEPTVQRAVNRSQSVEETLTLIDDCRDHGIRSVNVDLIYGLPCQTLKGFRHTLRLVTSARPDRVAVYAYAHLPNLFKAQRHIDPAALPDAGARLDLLRLAIEELSASGYRYVGMDHFALPEDELVRARSSGELQRNFMGYTTHARTDLLGLGMSAVSHVGDSFSQNVRDLKTWEHAIGCGQLPLWRGKALSGDDLVRGEVITQLMCFGRIDVRLIEERHGLIFEEYFADALRRLEPHLADGLAHRDARQITLTPLGWLLARSIAMCFDAYLDGRATATSPTPYSKLV
jgi:oxygen-independent coproporphyrinogen-3 oxidase